MLAQRQARRPGARMLTCIALVASTMLAPRAARAQSETERGENAWKAGVRLALQGNADSALASFAAARSIAETVHDSSLLAAALLGQAQVYDVSIRCADSSLALLRQATQVSIAGDRSAGLLLVRQLAAAGQTGEARTVHTRLFADLQGEVPRSISRESVGYLSALAAIQRGAGQDAGALQSLQSARAIANRLANGDMTDSAPAQPPTAINSRNYWVSFELASLMLTSKARGVAAPAEGKRLMDAVAQASDAPEEGNERRFESFRLADRLAVRAWQCELHGEKCPVPPPRKCR